MRYVSKCIIRCRRLYLYNEEYNSKINIMKLEDQFRGYDISTLLNQILDAKKHNFCNYFIIEKIQHVVVELMYNKKDIAKLIQSDDNEVFRLGIQMLFEDYLDQYNKLCENSKWESLVSDTIKNYKYYIDLNG